MEELNICTLCHNENIMCSSSLRNEMEELIIVKCKKKLNICILRHNENIMCSSNLRNELEELTIVKWMN